MSFGTINSPTARPTSPALAAANYFVTVNELTMHNPAQVQAATVQSSSSAYVASITPFISYVPLILFILLFIIAFGIQVNNGIRNARQVITALFIAIFAGGIPMVLTYVQVGTRQEVNASPEEAPRFVHVERAGATAARITWQTEAARSSAMKLGQAPMTDKDSRIYVGDNQQAVQSHTVAVPGLSDHHTYEFEILSGHTWYDNGGTFIRFVFRSQ